MNRQFRVLAGSLFSIVVLVTAAVVWGQTRPKLTPAIPKPETKLSTEIRARTAIFSGHSTEGTAVALRDDTEFGTVVDFVFSPDGCIDYVILLNGERLFPVPWAVARYDFDRQTVILEADRMLVQEGPTIKKLADLANPRLAEQIYKYYRVKDRVSPRGERDVDRPKAPARIPDTSDKVNRSKPSTPVVPKDQDPKNQIDEKESFPPSKTSP